MSGAKKVASFGFGILLIVVTCWGLWHLALAVFQAFAAVQPAVSAALIAGVATVVGATVAVMVGRYFERKKELEALYRDKKMPVYTAFLKEIFGQFQNAGNDAKHKTDMVKFLREWQLQIVLWGGPDVVNAYLDWKEELQRGASARSVFATERLIMAIRTELGNKNSGILRGLFPRMILRHSDLFLLMARENPGVSFDEVAKEEKRLGLEPE